MFLVIFPDEQLHTGSPLDTETDAGLKLAKRSHRRGCLFHFNCPASTSDPTLARKSRMLLIMAETSTAR